MHATALPLLFAALVVLSACDRSEAPVPPARVEAAAPLEQSATVADTVAVAPAVRVLAEDGSPVPGTSVQFIASGDGSKVAHASRRTGADGTASAGSWQLGNAAGDYRVIAYVDGLDAPVVFRTAATAAAPSGLRLLTAPAAVAVSGVPLAVQPRVRVIDTYGNPVHLAGVSVTAVSDGATTAGDVVASDSLGVATFSALSVSGQPGSYALRFTSAGLVTAPAAEPVRIVAADPCSNALLLAMQPGELRRYPLAETPPLCMEWNAESSSGQEFLVLLEHMPASGSYESALFAGAEPGAPPLWFAVHASPAGLAAAAPPYALRAGEAPASAAGWDFGDGVLLEGEPVHLPFEGAPLLLRDGDFVSLSVADPVPGDTLHLRMEGIPRLGVLAGNQRAVVRHVSQHLIIAEDVRLKTSLFRENGRRNTPLTDADLSGIATAYEQAARIQGDLLFDSRHNNAVEQARAGRVVAVHSLTGAGNIWGYTYPSGDYFIWDFWAGTDGSTRGFNQHPQRVADNLFMHEIAHLRHMGLLQRNGLPPRGNRWLVEGFARFVERLSIAARLTGSHDFSRTGNVALPRDPIYNNAYFRDDVPTFLNAGTAFMEGYHHSAWVFDYFADHVAARGADWRVALREFTVAAGAPATLDASIARWLPGLTGPELVTRARLALYLDDLPGAALPDWTQYLQYRLRESRPAGTAEAADPRNAWPLMPAGTAGEVAGALTPGSAWAFRIAGDARATTTRYRVHVPISPAATLSIVRIR